MSTKFDKYINNTYNGNELLKKYSLDTEGDWHVKGEDPNCDFGGHHYQPDLGVYKGKLEDVVRYCVELSNFWTWGGGGDFELIAIKKIDRSSPEKLNALKLEKERLTKRLEDIDKELKNV